jgi:excisionase family DNA binding protein
MQKTFEDAITAPDFSIDNYCGTSYAARLLSLSVATVQSLVEKGEIDAWKTLGGHRRIALHSIESYLAKNHRQPAAVQADPQNRLRVLLVEDDEPTRELYQLEFESWNLPIDCTWMASAMEALMDIASMRPDLLVTDLSMPGVDGFEMLKALKRNIELADMQVIVVSGLPRQAFDERGGFPEDAFMLHKPINFDWLQGFMSAMVATKLKKYQQIERSTARLVQKAPARSVALRERATSRLANRLSS